VDGAAERSRCSENAQRRLHLCGSHDCVCVCMIETDWRMAGRTRASNFSSGSVVDAEKARLLAQTCQAHRTGKCASCLWQEARATDSLILAINPSIRTTPSHSSAPSLALAASSAHTSRTTHPFSHTSRVRAHRPSPWPQTSRARCKA
jgi:hypothetical protein